MSAQFTWTPERIGILCRRYRDGALHSEIAEVLGTSKNACVGKFNRLLNEGHPIAIHAADARAGGTMDKVANWMASHGGSIAECAACLGLSYGAAKCAWDRVRARLGRQAR